MRCMGCPNLLFRVFFISGFGEAEPVAVYSQPIDWNEAGGLVSYANETLFDLHSDACPSTRLPALQSVRQQGFYSFPSHEELC